MSTDVVEEPTPDTASGVPQIRPYDFRNPSRYTRDHGRLLEQALESFAKVTATVMTTTLRTGCVVELEAVEQVTYGRYISSLPEATTMFLLNLSPLQRPAMFEFPLHSSMLMVDSMLGGGNTEDEQPERTLTEIEVTLISSLVDRLMEELGHCIQHVVPVRPSIIDSEFSPQFAQAASSGDQVVVAVFRMQIRENEEQATLVIPFGDLLPFLDRALVTARAQRSEGDAALIASAIDERMRLAGLEVSVRLRPTMAVALDIARLSPGDVLRLDHPVNSPLEVTNDNIVLAYAVPSTDGGRAVSLIVNPPEER